MRMPASCGLVVALAIAPVVVHAQTGPTAGIDVLASDTTTDPVMSSTSRFVAWTTTSPGILSVLDRSTGDVRRYTADDVAPGGGFQQFWELGGISDDGRYVLVTVSFSSTYLSGWLTVRFDRVSRTSVRLADTELRTRAAAPRMSRDGRVVAWLADWALVGQPRPIMLWTPDLAGPVTVGTTCHGTVSTYGFDRPCIEGPAVSGDGSTVLYVAGASAPEGIAAYDVASGRKTYYPQLRSAGYERPAAPSLLTGGDARNVLTVQTGEAGALGLLNRQTGAVEALEGLPFPVMPAGLSDDGSRVAAAAYDSDSQSFVLDRASGLVNRFDGLRVVSMSGNGRYLLARRGSTRFDVVVLDLDADGDGMLDFWERHFDLDPTTAADASADADGDGVSNRDEFTARSHPRGLASATRLFAEGAAGSFFDTTVSLFNPGVEPLSAVVRFTGPAGTLASRTLRLERGGRADISSCCIGPLAAAAFGVIVESSATIVADRRMTWDRVSGYGSHASSGVPSPSTTWFFAEGATVGGLQTFLLLQNPGAIDGTADVEFLLADGTPVSRTYVVPAGTRHTVWVNQEGGRLAAAEFATTVRTSVPMVAERAIYRDSGGQTFAAGTNAIGATSLASRWLFAEGTTRGGFDTFILAANPSEVPAAVRATFAGVDGRGAPVTVTRAYAVAPRSRLTIWVDQEDPALADADVTTTLEASAPIVAERAMWWTAGGPDWVEGHVEFGTTEPGQRFAIADVETSGATDTDTYVLVRGDAVAAGMTQLTFHAYVNGQPPIQRQVWFAGARGTVSMRQLFPELTGRFSVTVSTHDPYVAVPVAVEYSIYSHGFTAGASAKATKLQ